MGARNSFGHPMPTSRASSRPWDIPRKVSIWGSIAFAHKPRGCMRPWRRPGHGLLLGMCSLEAQMLLSILGSPHTQHGDVLGHRPLPHPIVRDVQELQPRASSSACALPKLCQMGRAGREGTWLVVNLVLPRRSCGCSSCKI